LGIDRHPYLDTTGHQLDLHAMTVCSELSAATCVRRIKLGHGAGVAGSCIRWSVAWIAGAAVGMPTAVCVGLMRHPYAALSRRSGVDHRAVADPGPLPVSPASRIAPLSWTGATTAASWSAVELSS
jgi:hypothetical protein